MGSDMHYIDEGEGDTILFIHGNPTSSYIWRNIIPYVNDDARVIAVDLIGMGKSDKPNIDYKFETHAEYLEKFIQELELTNITLVIHDWGSGLGFNYAMNNQDNIRGIVFMEALIMPLDTSTMSPQRQAMFNNMMSNVDALEESILIDNSRLEGFDNRVNRNMTNQEMSIYKDPYQTIESRKPLFVWVTEIPVDGKPANVYNIVTSYNQWLAQTEIPKLLFYTTPGAIVTSDVVQWSIDNMKNLQVINLGNGGHFLQEEYPHQIGAGIKQWYKHLD